MHNAYTHIHTQNKTVYEIAAELNRLHNLGLAGHLPQSDIAGGTFSLSNIGAVGFNAYWQTGLFCS